MSANAPPDSAALAAMGWDPVLLHRLDYVSPTAIDKLQRYILLLRKWQSRINLISPGDIPHLMTRHVLDACQLYPLVGARPVRLLDMGSGAGFPGLVLAMLGVGEVTLIESDRKKAAFLQEVAAQTQTPVTVLAVRIEQSQLPYPVDVITARGLAPLDRLLDLVDPFLQPSTFCLFPKGKNYVREIEAAQARWRFTWNDYPSQTDSTAAILDVRNITRHASPPSSGHRRRQSEGRRR